jgi:hypothetical protein
LARRNPLCRKARPSVSKISFKGGLGSDITQALVFEVNTKQPAEASAEIERLRRRTDRTPWQNCMP